MEHPTDLQKDIINSIKQTLLADFRYPSVNDSIDVYKDALRTCISDNVNFEIEKISSIYITIATKWGFPVFEGRDWNIQMSQLAGENIDLFVQSSSIGAFVSFIIDFIEAEDYIYLEFLEDFINLLKDEPQLLNDLPDAVFAIARYIWIQYNLDDDLDQDDDYFDEDMDLWKDFCHLLNIWTVPDEKIIAGVKWLIVMNTNREHATMILKMCNIYRDEIVINEVFKSLFEDDNQNLLVSSEILYKYVNNDDRVLSPQSYFYNTFKTFIQNNKDQIPPTIFKTNYASLKNSFILEILDCGELDNNTNDPRRFATPYNINHELVQLLVQYQIGFTYAFFVLITQEVILRFEETRYDSARAFNNSRVYLFGKLEEFFRRYSLKIPFDKYILLKEKLDWITQYHDNITKHSIITFLNRLEPSQDIIDAWNAIWELQGMDEVAPPPPDWFIEQHDTVNVHSRSLVKITDCRLKLLKENYPNPPPIDEIAVEIEEVTRRHATENASTETFLSDDRKEEYIQDHTIKANKILDCRISEDEPRYYGYGEIYDQVAARALPEDQRVELCSTLSRVWLVIRATKDRDENMFKNLVAQFVGAFQEHLAGGVCHQGWVGGLMSVFGGSARELGYSCREENDDEEKINELAEKLLVDMREYIPVSYPTISKLFTTISGILTDAKLDDEVLETLEEELQNATTDSERQEISKKIQSFKDKIRQYDILFEKGEDVIFRRETMKKFIQDMKPTFFMDVYTYFNESASEKESILHIKKAVLKALVDFTDFQLRKIY